MAAASSPQRADVVERCGCRARRVDDCAQLREPLVLASARRVTRPERRAQPPVVEAPVRGPRQQHAGGEHVGGVQLEVQRVARDDVVEARTRVGRELLVGECGRVDGLHARFGRSTRPAARRTSAPCPRARCGSPVRCAPPSRGGGTPDAARAAIHRTGFGGSARPLLSISGAGARYA